MWAGTGERVWEGAAALGCIHPESLRVLEGALGWAGVPAGSERRAGARVTACEFAGAPVYLSRAWRVRPGLRTALEYFRGEVFPAPESRASPSFCRLWASWGSREVLEICFPLPFLALIKKIYLLHLESQPSFWLPRLLAPGPPNSAVFAGLSFLLTTGRVWVWVISPAVQ